MNTAAAGWISHAALGTVLGFVALWAWLNLSFPGGPEHPDEPGIAADVVALASGCVRSRKGSSHNRYEFLRIFHLRNDSQTLSL